MKRLAWCPASNKRAAAKMGAAILRNKMCKLLVIFLSEVLLRWTRAVGSCWSPRVESMNVLQSQRTQWRGSVPVGDTRPLL